MTGIATIQQKLDVPENILQGLLSGLYSLDGGTVRNATDTGKGQIVALLKTADSIPSVNKQGFLEKVTGICGEHKFISFLAGAGTAAIVGYNGYRFFRNRKNRKMISAFEDSFQAYLEELQTGCLTAERIDALITAIDGLKQLPDSGKIMTSLSVAQVELIVRNIRDLTFCLAERNMVELTGDEQRATNTAVLDLQTYLRAQKRILETAA